MWKRGLILVLRTCKTHEWRKTKGTNKSAQKNLENERCETEEKFTGSYTEVDYEQSLFFFRFNEGSVRSRESRETRAAAFPVSCLQSRAWSFACLARFDRRTKKKERLLVVLHEVNPKRGSLDFKMSRGWYLWRTLLIDPPTVFVVVVVSIFEQDL